MANFFDQFDDDKTPPAPPPKPAAAPAGSGNFFGQFDTAAPAATPAQLAKPRRNLRDELPIPGPEDVFPPLVNFLTAGPRGLAADIAGGTHAKPGEDWSAARQRALKTTEIPQTAKGENISAVLNAPGEMIGRGVKAASESLLGPERTEQLAPYATVANDALSTFAPMLGKGSNIAERRTARVENKARDKISESFAAGTPSGGPSAADALLQMQEGRAEGQPVVLADINNPELRNAIGTIYRQGGAGSKVLKDFFEGRDVLQGERVRDLIGKYISDESARDTAAWLMQVRSRHGRELFEKATEGGSIAPLETQFQAAWDAAGKAEYAAARAVAQAEAKTTQAGDVQGLRRAQEELGRLQAEKAQARERLVRAQADRTAEAPGAVWSPRLQTMLDLPEVQRGLREGYRQERRRAIARGDHFQPSEYAVLGEDEHGAPIVGAVPNMRLLQAAKEGLDVAVSKNLNEWGRPTKRGQSYIELRDALVGELDRLNPAYREARQAWSGETASIMALNDGYNAFKRGRFKDTADVADYYQKLGANDREFFKMGVAQNLMHRLEDVTETTDKGRVMNRGRIINRMREVLGDAADPLLAAMEREREMRSTGNETMKGSQTQQRAMADERASRATQGFLWHALRLHPLEAARSGVEALRARGARPNMAVNEQAARLVTDPSVVPNTTGGAPLLPRQPVPVRQFSPYTLGGVAAALDPQDDPVARAMRGF